MDTPKPITTKVARAQLCKECEDETFNPSGYCHRCHMARYGDEEPHSRYEGDPERQRLHDAGVKPWGPL